MKRITAVFYRSSAGGAPVREWLMALDDEDRRIVGMDMATVEYGWPVGMPTCWPLNGTGRGLKEVRSTIRKGKVEARIVFMIDSDKMILLHGFEKDAKRQAAEINLADSRRRDYVRRKG